MKDMKKFISMVTIIALVVVLALGVFANSPALSGNTEVNDINRTTSESNSIIHERNRMSDDDYWDLVDQIIDEVFDSLTDEELDNMSDKELDKLIDKRLEEAPGKDWDVVYEDDWDDTSDDEWDYDDEYTCDDNGCSIPEDDDWSLEDGSFYDDDYYYEDEVLDSLISLEDKIYSLLEEDNKSLTKKELLTFIESLADDVTDINDKLFGEIGGNYNDEWNDSDWDDGDWDDGNWDDEDWDDEDYDDEMRTVSEYQVNNGEISESFDKDIHKEIWDRLKLIVPDNYRKMIKSFIIATDGEYGTEAYMEPLNSECSEFAVAIDTADVAPGQKIDMDYLTEVLVHEFGHIITLNESQFEKSGGDGSTYETFEGVLKEESYLNKFYQKFWTEIIDDLDDAWDKYDRTGNDRALIKFYENNSEQFVTEYAATNPEEDIAESFAFYILNIETDGTSVQNAKVNFFNQFEELRELKNSILNNMKKPAKLL
jgi:hypothetical protein